MQGIQMQNIFLPFHAAKLLHETLTNQLFNEHYAMFLAPLILPIQDSNLIPK